jgi:hypothetical protein
MDALGRLGAQAFAQGGFVGALPRMTEPAQRIALLSVQSPINLAADKDPV